jgi:hypothetical protein
MALTLLPDQQYTAPSAANAVSITPNASAWVDSAYVELLAATPSACVLTGVTVYTADGASGFSTSNDAEVDIATGAAGSETVIATIRVHNNRVFSGDHHGPTNACLLPIPIDNIGSGVRLSARLRKNSTTTTAWAVAITYLRKPLTTTKLTTAVVQKVLPSAAVGVTVTAGGSAWTSGSWAQLRSASGSALVIVGIVFGAPSASTDFELDLGTGGAGSETVITTLRLNVSNQGMPSVLMLPNPLDNVAASTRLAARLRCASASHTMLVSVMVFEKPL